MAWLAYAVKRPVRNFTNSRRARTDGVVLHVSAGPNASSLFGWFNNPKSSASSHFHVAYDGTIEQYVDTDLTAWAQVRGDSHLLSIETQGAATGEWTEAQLASLARLLKDLSAMYGFPLSLMGSSRRGERGVGYHLQGVPANKSQKARGVSQTGGELWSGAVGKVCPGPDRVRQIPALIARAAGGTVTAPTPMVTDKSVGCVDTNVVPVAEVQRRLASMGLYDRVVDGIDGDYTRQAVLAYQQRQGYHPNLLADGYWGQLEERHHLWVADLQRALNGWQAVQRLGEVAIDGDYGPYTGKLVRAVQEANLRGTYQEAVTAVYGAGYTAVADGVPGAAFCHMLGISTHPTA